MTVFAEQSKTPYEISFTPEMKIYSLNTVLNKQRETLLDFVTNDQDHLIPTSTTWIDGDRLYYYESFCDTVYPLYSGRCCSRPYNRHGGSILSLSVG